MKELRKELRHRRKSIDKPTRKKEGKKILHQCQKNGLFRSAKHIAIFTPNDGEIETHSTITFLTNNGYFVYLPILVGEKLKFAKMGNYFRKNRFGIDEPIYTPQLGANQMDLILMPLVGFDKNKNQFPNLLILQLHLHLVLFLLHNFGVLYQHNNILNQQVYLIIRLIV